MTNPLTQDELMKMAKQAGFTVYPTHEYIGAEWSSGGVCITEEITKFAKLIQQAVVPQALEKAAQYVDGMVSDEDGRAILTKSTISVGIRALIDQPVIKDSLTVEQGVDELVEALETIAAYPLTRDQEMGVAAMRKIAREALANRRGGE